METNSAINWTSFKEQVEKLLVVGYCLPHTVQLSAIEHIDSKLDVWKAKVARQNRSSVLKKEPDKNDLPVPVTKNSSQLLKQYDKGRPVVGSGSNITHLEDEVCPNGARRRGRKRKIEQHAGSDPSCLVIDDRAHPKASTVLTRSSSRRQKPSNENCSIIAKMKQEVDSRSYSLRRKHKEPQTVRKIKKEFPDPGKDVFVDHQEESSQSPSKGNTAAAKSSQSRQTAPKNNPSVSATNSPTANSRISASKITRPVAITNPSASEINQSVAATIHDSSDINQSVCEADPAACEINQSASEANRSTLRNESLPANEDIKEENLTVEAKNSSILKQCHLCHKTYNSNSGYIYHMKMHQKKSFPCADCSFVGLTARQLDRHIINTHCEQDESQSSLADIKRKERRNAKKKVVVFSCELCDKKFVSEYNLKFHIKIHKNGPLQCPECPKIFHSKIGFDAHMRMHTGEGLSHCTICDYVTGSKGTLKKHINQVHHREATYLCDLCGKGFTSKQLLARHDAAVHRRDEMKSKHACPHCDHTTHDSLILKAHIRNMHTDRESHMCSICGITLKYKHSLLLHMKRHSSNKTIGCPECSYKGICQKDVRAHIKRRHTDGATFNCDICGKSFNDTGHLARHRVIHTGEKNHACQFCTYRCNVKSNLSKHMVSVHKFKEIVRFPIQKIDQEEKVSQEMPDIIEVVRADTTGSYGQSLEGNYGQSLDGSYGQSHEVPAPAVSEINPSNDRTIAEFSQTNISTSGGGLSAEFFESHPAILGLPHNSHVTRHVTPADLHTPHTANHVIVSEALKVIDGGGNTCAQDTDHVTSHVTLSNAIPVLDHATQISGVNLNDDNIKQVYISADDSIHLVTDSNSVVYMTIDS